MTDLSYIVRVAVTTVAVCSLMIVGTLLLGLWFTQVDNKMIFDVLGPMAHEITGALICMVSGITVYYFTTTKENKA